MIKSSWFLIMILNHGTVQQRIPYPFQTQAECEQTAIIALRNWNEKTASTFCFKERYEQ